MAGRDVGGVRWGLLAHPLCTGPVAVLAVNDVVLKSRWPGWWTGKSSDVAGVVVVTVLLAAVSGDAVRSGALTAVGFVALKLVPGVAESVAPALGGVTRRDPTDLVALLVVPPAVGALGPLLGGDGRSEPAGAVRFRGAGGLPRVVLSAAGAGVAVLAISATSCMEAPEVTGLVTREDVVWAHGSDLADGDETGGASARPELPPQTSPDEEREGEARAGEWARSDDGGRTWVASDPPSSSPAGAAPVTGAGPACSDSAGCFRIDGRRVEHRGSEGGPWTTSFAFTDEQRRRLRARSEPCNGRSTDIVFTDVAIVPGPDGDRVVVGAGPQGVLHRTVDGAWERRPVLDATPAPLHGPSQLRYLSGAPSLLAAASVVLLVVGLVRRWPPRAFLACAVALAGAVGIGVLFLVLEFGAVDYTVTGPVVAGLSVAVFVVSLLIWRRGPRRGPGSPAR